jgi:hypothetical protein
MTRLIEIPEGIFKKTIKNGKVTTNEDAFRDFICQPNIASKVLPVYDMEGLQNYQLHFVGQEIDFGHGPFDGLFIDKYGIFTILEVKRAADSRTRREVLVQLLDYGSAFNRMTWPELASELVRISNEDTIINPDKILAEKWFKALYGTKNPKEYLVDEFSNKIATNLEKGYIRLIDATEVIDQTLVDLAHYVTHDNQNFSLGLCELSLEEIKDTDKLYINPHLKFSTNRFPTNAYNFSPRFKRKGKREWDKETFIEELRNKEGGELDESAKKIMDWVEKHESFTLSWGKGASVGSFSIYIKAHPEINSLFSITTSGKIEMGYSNKPISEELRQELYTRLKKIDPNISDKIVKTWGNMSLEALVDERKLSDFLATFEWFNDKFKKSLS